MLALSVAPLQGNGPSMTTLEMSTQLTPSSFVSESVVFLGGGQSLSDTGSIPVSDGFTGCLDHVVVNGAQLSLLLPNEMDDSLLTCSPR